MAISGNIAVVVCQFKGHVLVFDVDPENGKLYQKQAKIKIFGSGFILKLNLVLQLFYKGSMFKRLS